MEVHCHLLELSLATTALLLGWRGRRTKHFCQPQSSGVSLSTIKQAQQFLHKILLLNHLKSAFSVIQAAIKNKGRGNMI